MVSKGFSDFLLNKFKNDLFRSAVIAVFWQKIWLGETSHVFLQKGSVQFASSLSKVAAV